MSVVQTIKCLLANVEAEKPAVGGVSSFLWTFFLLYGLLFWKGIKKVGLGPVRVGRKVLLSKSQCHSIYILSG